VDDSGNRGGRKEEPYFCLGGFSVDGCHLNQLGHRMAALRRKWSLAPLPHDEIKMQHVGMDKHSEKKPNPLVRDGHERAARIEYASAALTHLVSTPSVMAMAVGVDRRQLRDGENAIIWAFRLLMERFEFSLNNEHERVGIVICDNDNSEDSRMRTAMYAGTVWTDLPNIAETVMFVPSHHSPGVQLADFVVGAASRWWNFRDSKYLQIIRPILRTDGKGNWRGAGLKSFRSPDYPDLDG